jgi:hypothetical protein
VPVNEQAAHLRELRDAYGPVPPEALIDAMIRSQDRAPARVPADGPSARPDPGESAEFAQNRR